MIGDSAEDSTRPRSRRQLTSNHEQPVQLESEQRQPAPSDQGGCHDEMNALLDQAYFLLDEVEFAWFQAMLDLPPEPNDQLLALLLTKAPWV